MTTIGVNGYYLAYHGGRTPLFDNYKQTGRNLQVSKLTPAKQAGQRTL
jgi:hypothetical protein